MNDLISRQALYEKTAEWEARALAVIEKMNRKPFEEMDANEITEWRKWSCILGERSAFKHDVADAPSAQPEIIRCKYCKYHPNNPRPYADNDTIETFIHCQFMGKDDYCSKGVRMAETRQDEPEADDSDWYINEDREDLE